MPKSSWPLLLAVLAIAVFAVLLAMRARRGDAGAWPYTVRRVLSAPEQVLYHRLVKALPDNIVLAQVQVSRVLGVKMGAPRQQWLNRINRLSYDFVVCAKDGTPRVAIELDDKSHDDPKRSEADARKQKATQAAGLNLIRWNVRTLPSEQEIQAQCRPSVNPELPGTKKAP